MKKTLLQVIYQLRSQTLLSLITIGGTALAISLIMVILIVYQAKTADYAPEVNRSRSLYVKWERTTYPNNGAGHSRPSLWLVKEIFYRLRFPEAVTASYDAGEVLVSTPASDEEVNTPLYFTDSNFWVVYRFRFLAGGPFTKADFEAGLKRVVIARSVARRLFGSEEAALGQTVTLNFAPYTVCGVVDDVNRFCEFAYAEAYAPYTSNAVANTAETGQTSGNYCVTILAESAADFEAIREEVDILRLTLNGVLAPEGMALELMGQPDDFRTQLNRKYANQYDDLNANFWRYGIMIAVILLVPAVNLSGLTHTRMRRRLEELGVRKAFGSTCGGLVWQVLNENLLLTLLGGVAGLLLSYAALWGMSHWLLQTSWGATATMNLSMVRPEVFGVAFGFCLVLNLLSAFVPAWRVAHTPIVDSLNQKL